MKNIYLPLSSSIPNAVRFALAMVVSLCAFTILGASNASAAPGTCTWQGDLNANMSTAGNWGDGGGNDCGDHDVPTTGDTLVFPEDATEDSVVNDISGLVVADVSFTGDYAFDGQPMEITSNLTATGGILQIRNSLLVRDDGGTVGIIVNSADVYLMGDSPIEGSAGGSDADIVKSGDGDLHFEPSTMSGATDWEGSLSVTAGRAYINDPRVVGQGGLSVSGTSLLSIAYANGADATYDKPFQFSGGYFVLTQTGTPGNKADDTNDLITLSGAVTFSGEIEVAGNSGVPATLKLTGPVSSTVSPSGFDLATGENITIVIASSDNDSEDMPNGTVKPPKTTITISDETSDNVVVHLNQTVVINGARADVVVNPGGTLKGTGSVGVLTVLDGGTVSPGLSPGCLDTGNVTIHGSYDVEIAGATGCEDYDRLDVTGTVDLSGATLNVSFLDKFVPKVGNVFVIINNDSVDAITGTFEGLDEGDTFKVGNVTFMISYGGGGGENDVVLTVVDVDKEAPGSPNTGAGGLMANPVLTGLATLLSSGSIALIARRLRLFS